MVEECKFGKKECTEKPLAVYIECTCIGCSGSCGTNHCEDCDGEPFLCCTEKELVKKDV